MFLSYLSALFLASCISSHDYKAPIKELLHILPCCNLCMRILNIKDLSKLISNILWQRDQEVCNELMGSIVRENDQGHPIVNMHNVHFAAFETYFSGMEMLEHLFAFLINITKQHTISQWCE